MEKNKEFFDAMFTYEISYNHEDPAPRFNAIRELQEHLLMNDAYS